MKKRNSNLIYFILLSALLFPPFLGGNIYAQEAKKIPSIEAFDKLNTIPDTYLIDVRTRAEYQYIGHPYKAYLFPYMVFTGKLAKVDEKWEYQLSHKNKNFVKEISKVFKKTDNLLIISRDGTRSALAAKDLISEGFKKVSDIEYGFEGPEFPTDKDKNLHKFYRQLGKRNKIFSYLHRRHYGWQWWGLPWTYEIDPKYIYPADLKAPEK
ncbi:rhodanese-like domain-containing protein [Thermodesulfobacteriota bacterium]